MRETPQLPPKPISKQNPADWAGSILFGSRWLLYPMNFGLAIAGFVYMIRFLADTFNLVVSSPGLSAEEFIVPLLGLADMLMIANLLVMLYQGSHQIFIRKFASSDDRPQWLDHVDSGILKLKVASSVAGITLIRMLKDFVNIENTPWKLIVHRAIVHGVCLISCIVMAVVWRMTHPPELHHPPEPHHEENSKIRPA